MVREDRDEVSEIIHALKAFYQRHPHIKESHGLSHALAVHGHSLKAIECVEGNLNPSTILVIQIASLLHDVDDRKYFPASTKGNYPNAMQLMCESVGLSPAIAFQVVDLISMVSCSANGNTVPTKIEVSGDYHLLIPRWSDRLEAVGVQGVWRCYQYNRERNLPLTSAASPRANTKDEVWAFATPKRFADYQASGGESADMISHFYDKLLHIACPPANIVRNAYLEKMGEQAAGPLVAVCLRFGQTGEVDEEYIRSLVANKN